jgi:hypothetical protein
MATTKERDNEQQKGHIAMKTPAVVSVRQPPRSHHLR